MRVIPGPAPEMEEHVEVAWLDADGEQRAPLGEAAGAAFEYARPVRSFPSYKGQRNFPGLYWSATVGGHVGFESWLERDHAMLLDFDPAIIAFAAQPMWLFWPESTASGARRWRSHAPDFFARRADGSALLIDCRPAERVKPRDAAVFARSASIAASVGWDYQLAHAVDSVLADNVRWLAGYRHPRFAAAAARDGLGERLHAVFTESRPLRAGVEQVGPAVAVLPVAFTCSGPGIWTATLPRRR